jgi:hypothetical protein
LCRPTVKPLVPLFVWLIAGKNLREKCWEGLPSGPPSQQAKQPDHFLRLAFAFISALSASSTLDWALDCISSASLVALTGPLFSEPQPDRVEKQVTPRPNATINLFNGLLRFLIKKTTFGRQVSQNPPAVA